MALSRSEQSKPVTLVSVDGQEIGRVTAYHVARTAALPVFAQVAAEAGHGQLIVPILHGKITGSTLKVPYSGAEIAAAPRAATLRILSSGDLRTTIEHYGLTEVEVEAGEEVRSTGPTSTPPVVIPSRPPAGEPIPIPPPLPPVIIPAFVNVNMDVEG
ncbi:hypothetical protein [Kitasatospora sp. NPDC090091]|uniref:hypothetical protein n=1 Tax=Kitasatospora sp. NPDC090091 TaxID=3364081 RepID=UPI0037FF757F